MWLINNLKENKSMVNTGVPWPILPREEFVVRLKRTVSAGTLMMENNTLLPISNMF